jgi:hypothetical protein
VARIAVARMLTLCALPQRAGSSAPEARSVDGAGSGSKDAALRRVDKCPAAPRQDADQQQRCGMRSHAHHCDNVFARRNNYASSY